MLSGGDYMTPPPCTASGGDGEPLQQAGEGTGTGAAASGGNAVPDISGSGEAALYAGTETVSGNGADTLAAAAIQEGFLTVCLLLGLIAGILFMNGFFLWKARE